jgi:transposase
MDIEHLQAEVKLLRKTVVQQKVVIATRDVELKTANEQLIQAKNTINWLLTQLFGARSEKRVRNTCNQQMSLFDLETPELPPPDTITVKEYEKSNRKKKIEFTENECRLQFDEKVPVEVIEVPNPATENLDPTEYQVISNREKYLLCVKPTQYYVKKYVQPVVKIKDKLFTPEPPSTVLEKSYADFTFLAHLIVQKFKYHIPLYRQYQMMEESGINVARGTLSRFIHRCSELLEPIHLALVSSVLQSEVIAIDETPLKVGVSTTRKGMHTGYLVPMYGDNDEVVFHYSPTRALDIVTTILGDYRGTIITDGFKYYENLSKTNNINHALCWSHARREFLKAEKLETSIVDKILGYIAELYKIEDKGKEANLLQLRQQYSKPLVDTLFHYYDKLLSTMTLTSTNPLTKALLYSLKRKSGLTLFLDNPKIPIDTNHLEREIRPTAVGRKNWLFCMNDIGAKAVAIFSSLIRTCELHNVNQFNYFCDILTRIESHPAKDVALLTPRNWKDNFQY